MPNARQTLSFVIALATCPCHLPLILPLLFSMTSGTAFGAYMTVNPAVVVIFSTAVFVAALWYALRAQRNNPAVCELPTLAEMSRAAGTNSGSKSK